MKPAPFSYVRPDTVDEALAALASDPDAKVLAGGQSLLPLLSMRLLEPSLVVDINGLAELAAVTGGSDGVRVGALARQSEVKADAAVAAVQPLLPRTLSLVAHDTIRNRGTVVGSLVHADAAAELPAVLVLLGGSLTARSVAGERTINAGDLYVGPLESALRHDELAVSASFPALPGGSGVACDEVSRRHGDYALCGAAAVVSLGADGRITSAAVGFWSMADVPVAVDVSEVFAAGRLDDEALHDAAELALSRLDPGDDIHATADYRAHLARVLTRRVLRAAHADAVHRVARREGAR